MSQPQICLGPVCVPLHLLIPFVLAYLHRHGYLRWVKKEWVTLRWWVYQFRLLYYRSVLCLMTSIRPHLWYQGIWRRRASSPTGADLCTRPRRQGPR